MHGEYARCGISHTNAKDSPQTPRDLTSFEHPQSPVLNPFPHIYSLLAKEMLVPLIFSSILIAICTALSQLK